MIDSLRNLCRKFGEPGISHAVINTIRALATSSDKNPPVTSDKVHD